MRNITCLAAVFVAAVLVGCGTTPTKFDQTFANVQTNYVPHLVLQTNTVTEVKTVTVTNEVGVPVPVFLTNFTSVITYQTNTVPQYVLVPNATATGIAGTAGAVGNLFAPGTGELITGGILAILSIFLGIRNRQFKGQNDTLTQSAAVLAQIIETGRELMSKTPGGQKAADAFTQWLVTHQAETDTIAEITKIVKESTDNSEAQKAADQILALINKA
jgi:hypothetical protein